MIASDLAMIDHYDAQIRQMESYLIRNAKVDDAVTFGLLPHHPRHRADPGPDPALRDRSDRSFPEAGNLLSYSRLVRCEHSSAGKVKGSGGKKIGNCALEMGVQ